MKKVLIANRGEIAVRVIRALRELGMESVAIYSEADKYALHVQMADEAICIGPAKAQDSYLNMQNIISAACLTKASGLHPGFGFLSENSVFAQMCKDCHITFIGPSPETIHKMGHKSNARRMMKEAGVPVIPGSDGLVSSLSEAADLGESIGYPIMLKAAAGGGGKGIRIVHKQSELESAFYATKSEAKAAFGDDGVYIEKVIEHARHIEIQVLADQYGNVIHLGERECSLQRRNQKVLEEAPSAAVDEPLRKAMGQAAVKAAKAAEYTSAGTIEFLLDADGKFYFMEMNTRIQVEHPVTEMVTGIDIVKEQLRIASGKPLSYQQKDIKVRGHAIECRINAEDPQHNFAPSPGTISYLLLPGGGNGLRVDAGVYAGYTIPPFYDSMIAKVIARGNDRKEAIAIMLRALDEFLILGVHTNIEFQQRILQHPSFIEGKFDTSFIEQELMKEQ